MLRRAQNQTRWQSKNWVFAFFSKSVHLIFLIFGMKLEGMAGHKMGLAAISRKLWFFHNCGILRAKITFLSTSQEPFDWFCSFFIKMCQIINGISTFISFNTNYAIKKHSCSDLSKNRPVDGLKYSFWLSYLIFSFVHELLKGIVWNGPFSHYPNILNFP